jgi:FAD/FMN-containing dehydrogenase
MATPGKLRAVYRAVIEAGATRAHISRFDADGAIIYLTLDGADVAKVERAAAAAGAWLLGARADKLDAYLRTLRATLDPLGIMNPGTLA